MSYNSAEMWSWHSLSRPRALRKKEEDPSVVKKTKSGALCFVPSIHSAVEKSRSSGHAPTHTHAHERRKA